MKKIITCVIALTFIGMGLYADKSKKEGYYNAETQSYSSEPAKELTPENSVLVFYSTSGVATKFVYTQLNQTKMPAVFKVKSEGRPDTVIMPLVEPGSFLKTIGGNQIYGDRIYIFSPELNGYYKFDIQVPSKPGIYYAGYLIEKFDYSSYEKFIESSKGSIVIGMKNEEEFNEAMKSLEVAALKVVLKKYKGTDWEPLINARMEELSK